MGSEMGNRVDSARLSAALVISRGLGLGQIEAQRFLGELTEEQRASLATDLQGDVETAQALAESRSVPFEDYVKELVGKGEVEESGADLLVLYRAGFDVGFRTRLVESVATVAAAQTATI
jgi:hypothetical protein